VASPVLPTRARDDVCPYRGKPAIETASTTIAVHTFRPEHVCRNRSAAPGAPYWRLAAIS
jgi:hypothetical protein